MISLVRIALSRPYTFVVMAVMIVLAGVLAALRTPADIFPNIPVPVVAVAWSFNGLSAEDMAGRIVTPYQRALTTTVNDIEHIEANSLAGIGIVKIFFQPGADIRLANAQITAVSQTLLRQLPPGTTPPLILNYNASTVPILQIALRGQGLSEQQLFDFGFNFIRTRLVTVPGAAMPLPFGGRQRQILIDINPEALQSKGLSAQDVNNAIAAQTQITPAGFVKIGEFQYNLNLNNAPGNIDELAALPIRTVNGAAITIADVANVRDGSPPQQNVVHVDGQRSVLMTALKSGAASTIDIVNGIRAMLPQLRPSLPETLDIALLNDQSTFVKAAINGVVSEGALAAALTSLMILLFLGSWRSTVIIATSIPLAVLAAIAALAAFGQTLNIMTLGGLALAVGILVDDATVTIENINWHLEHGKGVRQAILDGAAQIVVPAFVSLLCICIVFVPMFFLPGVSGFLFVPMALSVVFAMVASFVLSRTLVPTMAMYLLRPHGSGGQVPTGPLGRFQRRFESRFERLRQGYGRLLRLAFAAPRRTVIGFLAFAMVSLLLVPFLGRNFFPEVDSGSIVMHVRAPAGTRVEETAALFDRIQREVRQLIPAHEIRAIVDNVGLPGSSINLTYNASGTIGPMDGDMLIGLTPDHSPTAAHVARLRAELPRRFPTATFSFLPADITSQILNFGAPAPIDIQVTGNNLAANQEHAQRILRAIRGIDGLADARIQQPAGYPELRFAVDRTRISAFGLETRDVTASLAGSVAGSSQTAPVYWLNPANGVSYPIVAQAPEYLLDSLDELQALPVTGRTADRDPQMLSALGRLTRGATQAVVSQYNIQPMINVFATTQGRDLGAVAAEVQRAIAAVEKDRPPTVTVTLRGQYQTMQTAFSGMGWGLLGAVVMIYLLIVVNFQSWVDPFVIVAALPAALAGIAWMLFATGTPLSVPALTGAIMCMGVATANSILVVSFARERLEVLGDAGKAAFEAGTTRFRPVLMTALAMIIGMAPMAIGLGEGGEQNAPLGRAVIGGLLFATCASLIFVPTVFSLVHRRHAGHAGPARETPTMPEAPLPPAAEPIADARRVRRAMLLGGGLFLLVLAAGIAARLLAAEQLQAVTVAAAIPSASVVQPKEAKTRSLVLPARLQAWAEAPVYARNNGFLRSRYADIGDQVHAGDLLAEIDAPELEQQLAAATAALATAQAQRNLSAATARRWGELASRNIVSQQAEDERRGDLAAREAMLAEATANVNRLRALLSFNRVVAPFDGMVTSRATDIGALIVAGDTRSPPLFTISDKSRLRVYVRVPQAFAGSIVPGLRARFTVPDQPGRVFTAELQRSADAMDVQSGTMLVQLVADNAEGLLKPGSYAQLQLELPPSVASAAVRVPASTLIFRREGTAVAVVDGEGVVEIRPVRIAQDLGAELEIGNGLSLADWVIDSPSDAIRSGDHVRVNRPDQAHQARSRPAGEMAPFRRQPDQ